MNVKKILILAGVIFLIIILVVVTKKDRNDSALINNNGNTFEYGSGDYSFSLEHDDLVRKYFVHVPNSYDKKTPIPLILNFHGGGGSAEGHQKTSKMNEKSDSAGFIVVYPRGTRSDGDTNKLYGRVWNPGTGPEGPYYNPSQLTAQIDDVGFVNALLNDIESKFNIDKKRVYAAGLSNGGVLSHLLACKISNRIAAIASVAGPFWTFPEDCNPSRPVAVIQFHGTDDICAPYNGGISECSSAEADIDRDFISAKETVAIWIEKNNCPSSSSQTYQNRDVTCETYGPCDEKTEVTLCTIEGGGHTWPGGRPYSIPGLEIGKTTNDINANDAMWEFFEKHTMR